MEAIRRVLRSPITTVVLFALAAGLLLTSGIGAARAADLIESLIFDSQVEQYDIGVTLTENGSENNVAWRNYIRNSDNEWDQGSALLLSAITDFKPGVTYDEALAVKNTGTIDEYVRVTVYKYWAKLDENGNVIEKLQDCDPSLIDLHLLTDGKWIVDEMQRSSTEERTVLYYRDVLPAGAPSDPFTDTLTVNGQLAKMVAQENRYQETREDGRTYTVIETTYLYDGVYFVVEAQVDAVQTHNAHDAMLSAWGRNVTLTSDDGTGSIVSISAN